MDDTVLLTKEHYCDLLWMKLLVVNAKIREKFGEQCWPGMPMICVLPEGYFLTYRERNRLKHPWLTEIIDKVRVHFPQAKVIKING
jgi:hypothetical protein